LGADRERRVRRPVRTRDADNLVLDVNYADVTSTTYSGGR
jgi:hypothetical protein